MAIGMKVMVTQNVVTDLDITNGARGTHRRHGCIRMNLLSLTCALMRLTIILNHLPVSVLVKLDHIRTTQLTGLEECVIPVELASQP